MYLSIHILLSKNNRKYKRKTRAILVKLNIFPSGVTGNTSDFDSEEWWFETILGSQINNRRNI